MRRANSTLMVSSAFGWIDIEHTQWADTRAGDIISPGVTEEERIENAPFLTIASTDPVWLRHSVSKQTMSDYRALECPLNDDLSVFCMTVGRYAFAILDNKRVLGAVESQKSLFMRLASVLLRYQPSMLILTYGFRTVGYVFDRALFMGRAHFPRSNDGVFLDLWRYMTMLGDVFSYEISNAWATPVEMVSPARARRFVGRYKTPLSLANGPEREILLRCLNAYPNFLPTEGRSGLWTCLANDWYEQRSILRRYIELEADLFIDGKLQHGWQSGCGIDGERGYKPEIIAGKIPVFLWSSRNVLLAKKDGILWANAIGAPIIYRENFPDPGPQGNRLLAFPYHSVPEYPIASDWRIFGSEIKDAASAAGFDGVTICLHSYDFDNDETREVLRRDGLEVVTVGDSLSPGFVDRLQDLIQNHAAVVSDRICTAGIYAEYWNRPFWVVGTPLIPTPPDPDYGLGADRDWIAREMPVFLKEHASSQESRDVALRELGMEFKQSRLDLTRTLYGEFIDV